MANLYVRKWAEVIDAAHSKYVFSERIRAGHVLHVHNCFAHAPEREINDIITLGVRNGGEDVIVRSRGGALAKEGLSTLRDFFVGGGDQVFAYFPDADNTDTVELHIIGDLMTLKEWRERNERGK